VKNETKSGNRALPVAVFVGILGCVLAVSANVTTSKIHENLDQERHARMLVEEQLQAATKDVKALSVQLNDSQKKISDIESILSQGKANTSELKSELDAVTKEKEDLANQLKNQKPEAK
jgi:septal ring factor EnvC (AmiA/AmiB activator)